MTTPTASIFAQVEEPIVAELFSTERLEQHAESLAAAQTVSSEISAGRPLIQQVLENGKSLVEYYRAIASAIDQDQVITPAAQWLTDNFYVVEEQVREIRDDLPPGYYRKLPKLTSGHLEGYPRIYGVAWAFVAHTDSHFDPNVLKGFIDAYQRIQPLTIGELWALAITLRVVLVENLRRISARIVSSREARVEANRVADRLLGTGGQVMVPPSSILRQLEKKPLNRAFVVELVQRLRDLDPRVGPILLWLDERLAQQGTTVDEVVRLEHQQQASMTVTVRNIITSMRFTSAFDWQTFFESISTVDHLLRERSRFGDMDFATRDSYRHAIEDLARESKHTELEITRLALEKAQNAALIGTNGHRSANERFHDPGYYLLSQDRKST